MLSDLAQRWLQHTGPISYEYTDTLVDYALEYNERRPTPAPRRGAVPIED